MQLTDAQKQTVKKWVEQGCGLSEIQKKLSAELGISITYMDVRLLMLDLGLNIQNRKLAPAPQAVAKPPKMAKEDEPETEFDELADVADASPKGSSRVTVEVSRLAKPGSLVSGSVTFSDGMSASWSLDQFGRLALMPGKGGYKPSEADIQAFQIELREALSRKGF